MLKKIEKIIDVAIVIGLMAIATVTIMTLTVGIMLGCMVWLTEFGFGTWIIVIIMNIIGTFMGWMTIQIDSDLCQLIKG